MVRGQNTDTQTAETWVRVSNLGTGRVSRSSMVLHTEGYERPKNQISVTAIAIANLSAVFGLLDFRFPGDPA